METMTTYVLILFFYVFSNGNNSTTSVPGFINMEECEDAGGRVQTELIEPRQKQVVNYLCVKQTVVIDKQLKLLVAKENGLNLVLQ